MSEPTPAPSIPAPLPDAVTAWLSQGRRAWVVAFAVALVQLGLMAHVAWDKSLTEDEPHYLSSGHYIWNGHIDGTYAPVTPLRAVSFALRLVEPELDKGLELRAEHGDQIQASLQHLLWRKPYEQRRWTLFVARLAGILGMVGGGLLLWRVGWRFGPLAALVTHVLWAFSPTLIGVSYQVLLDSWAGSTLTLVLWTAVRLYEAPRARWVAALAAACALAVPTKVTVLGAVGLAGLFCLWVAWRHRPAGDRLGWKRVPAWAALFGVTGFLVVWALYGFQMRHGVPLFLSVFRETLGMQGPLLMAGGSKGFNYAFGRVNQDGWWWYYVVCLGLQVTTGVLAYGVLRFLAGARGPGKWARFKASLPFAFPALLVLVVMSAASRQIGIPYLLAGAPFAVLWAGTGINQVRRAFGNRGVYVALGLVLLGAVEGLRIHPHEQMFYNLIAGGPEEGPRSLMTREDFGQDLRRLGEWQKEHHVERIFYSGLEEGAPPAAYGIEAAPVLPCEPTPGVYAIHAQEAFIPRKLLPGCADWLMVEPPDERLGYSIYVWSVDEARIARLAAARGKQKPFAETAYFMDQKVTVKRFEARREGKEVRLEWDVKNLTFAAIGFVKGEAIEGSEKEIVTFIKEGFGHLMLPDKGEGYYMMFAFPGYVIAPTGVERPALLNSGPIFPPEEAMLVWNVPQGPVVIEDDAGQVLFTGESAIGTVSFHPTQPTTYHLRAGELKLSTKVELRAAQAEESP